MYTTPGVPLFGVRNRVIDLEVLFCIEMGERGGLPARCSGMTVSRNDRFFTWHFIRLCASRTLRQAVRPLGNDHGSYHDVLTGNKRSISTLHLWQKNRDIGVPSTTASAMFYVSVSTSP